MKNKERLRIWQERLAKCSAAYSAEAAKMDEREALYLGRDRLRPVAEGDDKQTTPHVRNIAAEIIEAQVSSAIPQPKVTARRKQDEGKAKLIEDMLRGELDRMPFELLNDMTERTVPIQGGAVFLLEWDNTLRTHTTVGELTVSVLHPKQVLPQDGVYTGIEDMDYIILRIPQTKEYLRRRYGAVIPDDERESEPEVREASADGSGNAEDMVTQYMAYYRNESGGIGLYSWVNETVLCDYADYQARRLVRCRVCGEPYPGGESAEASRGSTVCPRCGARDFNEAEEEWEDEELHIPCYKPNLYPVILLKNVSVFGKFLGDSDLDKIADQQNTYNRMSAKVLDKLVKSGSYMTLPNDASIRADDEDMKTIRLESPADKAIIDVFTMEGDVTADMAYMAQVYEEARQVIGITDSFQGRRDATATSGKAKEFAAAQSAGRLESKRTMKDAAYAALFEAMFKFKLAYADEPRPVVARDIHGNAQYEEFNRYDFLEQDAAGEWYWNDQFLFSCDTSAPLAANREAMWQETRQNFASGSFGDPTSLTTLILFWTKMELLHYPGAGETKAFLEEERERQAAAEQAAMAMQGQAAMQQAATQQQQAAQQQAAEPAAVQLPVM